MHYWVKRVGINGSQIAYQTRHLLSTLYEVLTCLKDRGSVESRRPFLIFGSLILSKTNIRHSLYYIHAIFNQLRHQTVLKRTIQRKIYKEQFHKCFVWKKKPIRNLAENLKILLALCTLNRQRTINEHWSQDIYLMASLRWKWV